jgi:glycosyltransferase involved in cell wall biosynthesis
VQPLADNHVTRIASPLFYRGGAPDELEASPLRSLVDGVAFTGRLTAMVRQRAPAWSSIIAHWLVPSAIAALSTRVPLLAIAHGGDIHTLRRVRLLRPVLHALRLRGAKLAFVSAELRALAIREVPELARWIADAIVQPMGIDLARFAAIARTPTTPPTILVAGRLVPVKGIDIAIAAMRFVRTPARLVIAGDGPLRSELEGGARKATQAGPAIEFLGEVSTAERDRLLGQASVVVVPSRVLPNGRTEGTPLIAIEALAAGVPVVASAVGGLASLAGAHRVRPDDPRALAAAIDRVLVDPPAAGSLRAAVAELAWTRVARVLSLP